MGGALFNNLRMSKVEYYNLLVDLDKKLHEIGILKYRVPSGFIEKDSYGDLDVCLEFPLLSDQQLKNTFDLTDDQIHHNSSVISINYQNKQIDFCHFEPENLESAVCYMRNSDCGNMVGQMARYSTGYRLTHKGLMYPVRLKPEDQLGEILVSKNWKQILSFLDLDYQQWLTGFNDQYQLFEWITKSKYFNPDCFKFENLKHQDRTRNRKRKVYSEFVDWLNSQNFNNPYIPTLNKQEHLFRGLLHFHEKGFWINQAEPLITQRHHFEKARTVFNATNIIKLTGATGSDLGKIRKQFEEYLQKLVDNQHILYNSVAHYISERTTEQMDKQFEKWYVDHYHVN